MSEKRAINSLVIENFLKNGEISWNGQTFIKLTPTSNSKVFSQLKTLQCAIYLRKQRNQ